MKWRAEFSNLEIIAICGSCKSLCAQYNKDKISLFFKLLGKKNFISFLCTFMQLKQKNGSANEISLKIYVSTKF